MNCNLPKITYPRFRLLLLLKFHEAIFPEEDVAVIKRSVDTSIKDAYNANSRILNVKDVFRRVKNSTSVVVYRSAIALRLAAQTQRNVAEVAWEIANFYRYSTVNLPKENTLGVQGVLSDLTVNLIEGGLLEFEFGDRAIAAWLQALVEICTLNLLEERTRTDFTETLNIRTVQDGQAQIFLCQYTYARCCALLRIAAELGRLESDGSEVNLWLTEQGRLVFESERDRAFLSQIVTTLDEFVEVNAQSCLKLAVSLSQAFQEFYRESQIFGEISAKNLQLAQSRLGLVMITQSLLRSLLQQELSIPLPDVL